MSDEGGISIARPLAWAILVTLIAWAFGGGLLVSSLRERADAMENFRTQVIVQVNGLETRLRAVESAMAGTQSTLDSIEGTASRIERKLDKTNGTGERP